MFWHLLCLPALLAPSVLAADQPSAPVIDTATGPVRGSLDASGVASFKGIPYAAPPTGQLRWRAPQSAAPWDSPLDATAYGHQCWGHLVQPRDTAGAAAPSEDCLTLNVWTSSTKASESRPVMVWIHGGGFVFGSSAQPQFDGSHLAQKDVVVVTINYRLGVFGFLGHEDLDAEGANSGGFGLQDMLAALGWVRENIAAFGGNANDVTLFGESAGAHAVGLLMTSPLAKGTFHKAIMESGAFWDRIPGPLTSFAEARQKGRDLMALEHATTLAELRDVPAQRLIEAFPFGLDFAQDPGSASFAPSVDGYVIPEVPATVFAEHRQMKIPLLAGFTSLEGVTFEAMAPPHKTVEQYQAIAETLFGPRAADSLALYPTVDPESGNVTQQLSGAVSALTGDLVISQQTWEAAMRQAEAGVDDVFAYHYTYGSPYSPRPFHTAEINFVFGTLDAPPLVPRPPADASAEDRAFSDALATYWTNFAKHGNPNGGGGGKANSAAKLPLWPRYRGTEEDFMELGREIKAVSYNLDRFKFIQSFRTNGVFPASWRRVDELQAAPGGQEAGFRAYFSTGWDVGRNAWQKVLGMGF